MEQEKQKQSSIVIYLKSLSKKDKILLSATIIMLAIVFSFVLVFAPQLAIYETNIQKVAILDEQYSRLGLLNKENQLLSERNKELIDSYNAAIDELPKTPEVAQIAHDIKKYVSSSKVELKSMSFSEAELSSEELGITEDIGDKSVDTELQHVVKRQIVNVSVSGEYKNVIEFLKNLEAYTRVTEVANISMNKGEAKKVNANVTANFYNLNFNEKESYEFNDGDYGKENSFD